MCGTGTGSPWPSRPLCLREPASFTTEHIGLSSKKDLILPAMFLLKWGRIRRIHDRRYLHVVGVTIQELVRVVDTADSGEEEKCCTDVRLGSRCVFDGVQ